MDEKLNIESRLKDSRDQNLTTGSPTISTGNVPRDLRNLDFSVALFHLKKGQKIRRAIWRGHWFLAKEPYCQSPSMENPGYVSAFSFRNGLIVAVLADAKGCAPAQAYQEDLLAEDWEVIDFKFPR